MWLISLGMAWRIAHEQQPSKRRWPKLQASSHERCQAATRLPLMFCVRCRRPFRFARGLAQLLEVDAVRQRRAARR